MKLRITPIIILITFGTVFMSIGCTNYMCSDRAILTTFIGYKQDEIDTFVIRRYKKNDNFQTLLDSFVITNNELNGGKGVGVYTIKNDTTIVAVNDSYPDNGIFPGFDWKIFLPANNKTVSIFNINSEKNDGASRCINPINAFQQDNEIVRSPIYFESQDAFTTGYRAYFYP